MSLTLNKEDNTLSNIFQGQIDPIPIGTQSDYLDGDENNPFVIGFYQADNANSIQINAFYDPYKSSIAAKYSLDHIGLIQIGFFALNNIPLPISFYLDNSYYLSFPETDGKFGLKQWLDMAKWNANYSPSEDENSMTDVNDMRIKNPLYPYWILAEDAKYPVDNFYRYPQSYGGLVRWIPSFTPPMLGENLCCYLSNSYFLTKGTLKTTDNPKTYLDTIVSENYHCQEFVFNENEAADTVRNFNNKDDFNFILKALNEKKLIPFAELPPYDTYHDSISNLFTSGIDLNLGDNVANIASLLGDEILENLSEMRDAPAPLVEDTSNEDITGYYSNHYISSNGQNLYLQWREKGEYTLSAIFLFLDQNTAGKLAYYYPSVEEFSDQLNATYSNAPLDLEKIHDQLKTKLKIDIPQTRNNADSILKYWFLTCACSIDFQESNNLVNVYLLESFKWGMQNQYTEDNGWNNAQIATLPNSETVIQRAYLEETLTAYYKELYPNIQVNFIDCKLDKIYSTSNQNQTNNVTNN